jgi:hypothetical protein
MKKTDEKSRTELKTEIVAETLIERSTPTGLAPKYELNLNRIMQWKQEFPDPADDVR